MEKKGNFKADDITAKSVSASCFYQKAILFLNIVHHSVTEGPVIGRKKKPKVAKRVADVRRGKNKDSKLGEE